MMENLPAYAWGVGGAVAVAGLRYFWPTIKAAWSSQAGQWRTESGFVRQLSDELDRALARAEAADSRADKDRIAREEADRRADKYFAELAEMKTQVQLLTMQLKLANEKIDTLTARLNEVLGGTHARDDRGL